MLTEAFPLLQINKNIVKEIKYDGELGREIIQWNNTYTIIYHVRRYHAQIRITLCKTILTNGWQYTLIPVPKRKLPKDCKSLATSHIYLYYTNSTDGATAGKLSKYP